MNRIILFLLLSDAFILTGFGLIDPILAIFIKDNLVGGEIYAAGIASTIFLLAKSFVQLPFSRFVDNHDSKALWLIVGSLCIATVPFIYTTANTVNDIYLAQLLHGIGSGLAFPTWLGLWSTHLDKHHESYEWSLYSTITGIGTAIAAASGALMAEFLGFDQTFMIVGAISFIGCVFLFFIHEQDRNKKTLVRVHAPKHKR